jgi:hypothetical protein
MGCTVPDLLDKALRALELGPLNDEELAWMRRVGDYIHKH